MKLSFEWDEDKAHKNLKNTESALMKPSPFSPIPLQSPFMTMTTQRMNNDILI
jgi:hypothetical protein